MKKSQRYWVRLRPFSWLLLVVLAAIWMLCSTALPRFVESRLPNSVSAASAIAATTANPNVAVVMKFYEAYNDRTKIGLLDEIFASNYVGSVNGRKIPGIKASKGFINAFQDAFPDANYIVEDTIATGDRVVIRWDCTATHRGKFLGVDATGQPIEVTGITIFQLANGKIIRLWNNWDTYGLMQQLRSAG